MLQMVLVSLHDPFESVEDSKDKEKQKQKAQFIRDATAAAMITALIAGVVFCIMFVRL